MVGSVTGNDALNKALMTVRKIFYKVIDWNTEMLAALIQVRKQRNNLLRGFSGSFSWAQDRTQGNSSLTSEFILSDSKLFKLNWITQPTRKCDKQRVIVMGSQA